MKTLALNIETGANLALVDSLPEPEVKYGNTKDSVKREEKEEAARLAQRGKMALDAHYGKVLCVGFAQIVQSDDEAEPRVEGVVKFASDTGANPLTDEQLGEPGLLAWAWKQIAKADRLITFNGAGFDIPFMLRRSVLLRVRPSTYMETSKYRVISLAGPGHVDLMQILHESETGPGLGIPRSLSFYIQQFLGVEWSFADLDQGRLSELLLQEDGRQKIDDLCTWNVRHTLMLDAALQGIYP